MTQKPTSGDKPVNELFRDMFYDMLKAAGLSMDVEKLDTLRIKCEQLEKTLDKYAYDSSVGAIKRVQVVIEEAFKDVASDIDRLEKKIENQGKKFNKEIACIKKGLNSIKQ